MSHSIKATFYTACTSLIFIGACGPADDNDENATTNVTNAQLLDCSSLGEAEVTLTDNVDGGVDYIVDCKANVRGDLKIEPGVIIQFKDDSGFNVSGMGSISAEGTADKPIVLTGERKEKGSWAGVYISSNSSKNKLDHVTFEYAGGQEFNSNGDKGSIVLYASGKLSMKNSTITESANYGLNNNYEADLTFEKNTITKSELAPITIQAKLIHTLDADSKLTGNGKEYVHINDGAVRDGEFTWQTLTVPYYVNEKLSLSSSAAVTASAGSTYIFTADAGISVGANSSFKAEGTAESKIIFKGEVEEKGSWLGLFFNSNSANNILDHTEITHAGGGSFNSNDDRGAVILYSGSKIKIKNSRIAQSKEFGINTNYDISDIDFEKNIITECDREPLMVNADLAHKIDAESDFTGNARDFVMLSDAGNVNDMKVTWKNLSVPYYVPSGKVLTFTGDSIVTVEEGTELRFGSDAGLSVNRPAALTAEGTTSNRIQFLGEVEEDTSWRGLFFNSNSANNKLSHVTLKHGGGNSFNSNNDKGGIILYSGARLAVEDVIIEQSGACSINVAYDSAVLIRDGVELDLSLLVDGICLPD